MLFRSVRLSEAPSHGKPVNAYDYSSRGSLAYRQLAEEFLERNPIPTSTNETTS